MGPLPPGLDGYMATRQAQAQDQMQQMHMIQGLMQMQQQQQMMPLQKREMEAKLAKMDQEAEMTRALGPLISGGNTSPEMLDALGTKLALGGHPGAATVMRIADQRRTLAQNAQALQGMQPRQGVTPVTPNDDEGNPNPSIPGQPGLFSPLLNSKYVGPQAQAYQQQLNQGAAGMTPQQAMSHMDRLTQMHVSGQGRDDTQAQINARQDKSQANRIEIKNMFPPAAAQAAAQVPAIGQDALDMAASRYLTFGTLPPNLGRGTQGAMNTQAILSRAAAMAKEKGMDAQAATIGQQQNKAISMALGQLEKQRANVMTYEKTALGGADIALEMSDKVDRTGAPILNKWINAGRKNVMGDVDVTRLNNSVETFTNEYAKVMSGSSGGQATTVAMQQHAREMLSGAMTKDQFKGAVDLMKREMTQTREKAFDAQINEMKDRMRTGATSAPTTAPTTTRRKYNPSTGKIE